MAALATRAELVAEGDYYLMPLPMTGDAQNQFEGWLDQLVSGKVKAAELWDDQEFLGHAWEFTRELHAKVADQPIAWKERVQLLRSPALTQRNQNNLGHGSKTPVFG